MVFFQWKDSFNIGIDELDEQHKQFLEYINQCYTKISDEHEHGIDSSQITNLKQYAADHFHFEETLMQATSYPKIESQKAQHHYFESQITEFEASKPGGKKASAETLLEFMKDWFLSHILEQDKEFSIYMEKIQPAQSD